MSPRRVLAQLLAVVAVIALGKGATGVGFALFSDASCTQNTQVNPHGYVSCEPPPPCDDEDNDCQAQNRLVGTTTYTFCSCTEIPDDFDPGNAGLCFAYRELAEGGSPVMKCTRGANICPGTTSCKPEGQRCACK